MNRATIQEALQTAHNQTLVERLNALNSDIEQIKIRIKNHESDLNLVVVRRKAIQDDIEKVKMELAEVEDNKKREVVAAIYPEALEHLNTEMSALVAMKFSVTQEEDQIRRELVKLNRTLGCLQVKYKNMQQPGYVDSRKTGSNNSKEQALHKCRGEIKSVVEGLKDFHEKLKAIENDHILLEMTFRLELIKVRAIYQQLTANGLSNEENEFFKKYIFPLFYKEQDSFAVLRGYISELNLKYMSNFKVDYQKLLDDVMRYKNTKRSIATPVLHSVTLV